MRAALYYAQRFAILPSVRAAVSGAVASAVRLRHGSGRVLPNGGDRTAVEALRREGIYRLPEGFVSRALAARLLTFFQSSEVVAGGKAIPFRDLPSDTPMAFYPLETILANAEVRELLLSPAVLDIAARYLGCRPTLSSLGVRWSFPSTKGPQDTQQFHRDADDWRFVKLFVYLTDVTSGSGPHVFVGQSHRTPGRLRASFYPLSDLRERYGDDNLHEITGPAGTAFLADTYGIHAGMVPSDAPRLILQAQYSLLPIFAFQYEPVSMPELAPQEPYVSRLLLAGAEQSA